MAKPMASPNNKQVSLAHSQSNCPQVEFQLIPKQPLMNKRPDMALIGDNLLKKKKKWDMIT